MRLEPDACVFTTVKLLSRLPDAQSRGRTSELLLLLLLLLLI